MVLEQNGCAIKNVFGGDYVVPRRKRLEKSSGRRIPGRKSNGRRALFQRRQTALQRRAVWVVLARVAVSTGKTAVLSALKRGGEVNGRSNIARALLDSVAGMYGSCLNFHDRFRVQQTGSTAEKRLVGCPKRTNPNK